MFHHRKSKQARNNSQKQTQPDVNSVHSLDWNFSIHKFGKEFNTTNFICNAYFIFELID